MLLIAISHGDILNPFVVSYTLDWDKVVEMGFDPDNAKQCRDYLCEKGDLLPNRIDRILIIYSSYPGVEPTVQHDHQEFD